MSLRAVKDIYQTKPTIEGAGVNARPVAWAQARDLRRVPVQKGKGNLNVQRPPLQVRSDPEYCRTSR